MEEAAGGRVLLALPEVSLSLSLALPPRLLRGHLRVLRGPQDLELHWEPLEGPWEPPGEESPPDPGFEPDWAVLSPPRERRRAGWSGGFSFPLGELRGLRRGPPGLGPPLLVLLPRGGPGPPPLQLPRGGLPKILRVLGRRLRACPRDPRLLLLVTPEDPPEPPPEPGLVTRWLGGPYAAALGGLGRLLGGPRGGAGPEPDPEPPFEELSCVRLGPRPSPSRGPPLAAEDWGRGLEPEVLRERIFRGGLSPELRPRIWRLLLGLRERGDPGGTPKIGGTPKGPEGTPKIGGTPKGHEETPKIGGTPEGTPKIGGTPKIEETPKGAEETPKGTGGTPKIGETPKIEETPKGFERTPKIGETPKGSGETPEGAGETPKIGGTLKEPGGTPKETEETPKIGGTPKGAEETLKGAWGTPKLGETPKGPGGTPKIGEIPKRIEGTPKGAEETLKGAWGTPKIEEIPKGAEETLKRIEGTPKIGETSKGTWGTPKIGGTPKGAEETPKGTWRTPKIEEIPKGPEGTPKLEETPKGPGGTPKGTEETPKIGGTPKHGETPKGIEGTPKGLEGIPEGAEETPKIGATPQGISWTPKAPWAIPESERERRADYFRMRLQWRSLSPGQLGRNKILRGYQERLERDLARAPPSAPRSLLRDVLMTFCMFHFDLGYVSGMLELLLPLLGVFQDEPEIFWGFCGALGSVSENFGPKLGALGAKLGALGAKLGALGALVRVLNPGLSPLLDVAGPRRCCRRWLQLRFQRHLGTEGTRRLCEVLWTGLPCPNFLLLVTCALLELLGDTWGHPGDTWGQPGDSWGQPGDSWGQPGDSESDEDAAPGDTDSEDSDGDTVSPALEAGQVLSRAEGMFLQLAQATDLPPALQELLGLGGAEQ